MKGDKILREKQNQRRAGIRMRKSLAPEAHRALSAALCERLQSLEAFQRARTLLAYAAFGGEADLTALLQVAERQGKTVGYPVCLEEFAMTAADPLGKEGWEVGRYGIRTPVLSRSRELAPEELDLVLVPCTAFDRDCRRVGMGKGYYDRYLPRCRNALWVGVAFEGQRVPRTAADEHDQKMHFFVTERTVYPWRG